MGLQGDIFKEDDLWAAYRRRVACWATRIEGKRLMPNREKVDEVEKPACWLIQPAVKSWGDGEEKQRHDHRRN